MNIFAQTRTILGLDIREFELDDDLNFFNYKGLIMLLISLLMKPNAVSDPVHSQNVDQVGIVTYT